MAHCRHRNCTDTGKHRGTNRWSDGATHDYMLWLGESADSADVRINVVASGDDDTALISRTG